MKLFKIFFAALFSTSLFGATTNWKPTKETVKNFSDLIQTHFIERGNLKASEDATTHYPWAGVEAPGYTMQIGNLQATIDRNMVDEENGILPIIKVVVDRKDSIFNPWKEILVIPAPAIKQLFSASNGFAWFLKQNKLVKIKTIPTLLSVFNPKTNEYAKAQERPSHLLALEDNLQHVAHFADVKIYKNPQNNTYYINGDELNEKAKGALFAEQVKEQTTSSISKRVSVDPLVAQPTTMKRIKTKQPSSWFSWFARSFKYALGFGATAGIATALKNKLSTGSYSTYSLPRGSWQSNLATFAGIGALIGLGCSWRIERQASQK